MTTHKIENTEIGGVMPCLALVIKGDYTRMLKVGDLIQTSLVDYRVDYFGYEKENSTTVISVTKLTEQDVPKIKSIHKIEESQIRVIPYLAIALEGDYTKKISRDDVIEIASVEYRVDSLGFDNSINKTTIQVKEMVG